MRKEWLGDDHDVRKYCLLKFLSDIWGSDDWRQLQRREGAHRRLEGDGVAVQKVTERYILLTGDGGIGF